VYFYVDCQLHDGKKLRSRKIDFAQRQQVFAQPNSTLVNTAFDEWRNQNNSTQSKIEWNLANWRYSHLLNSSSMCIPPLKRTRNPLTYSRPDHPPTANDTKKLLPLQRIEEKRAKPKTFRLRGLNSQCTNETSLEGGG